jgi:hypothetical protein
MTIESLEMVETFCIFFQAGFVEDVWRSLTTSGAIARSALCSRRRHRIL